MAEYSFDWRIALTLGVLLWCAMIAGWVAGYVRLPRVTAYLLVGMLLGPVGLSVVDLERTRLLEPLTKLAISLVLFNLGCHFPLARMRRILRRVLRLSLGELSATFLLVFVGLIALGQRWEVALLLGILALATAPATTVLVLKETESEGPVTDYANALVALNNLVSIVLFELLFLAVRFVHEQWGGSTEVPTGQLLVEIGELARDVAGSVALGMAGGLIVSYAFGLVESGRRLVLLVSVPILLLAICQLLGMPYLLMFLAMGLTVANSSDQTRQIVAELDQLTGLLCVVFFAVHGAELEPGKLVAAGAVGVGYTVFRFSGKYFGIRIAARSAGEEPAVRNWLGATLLAQAGAALALSAIAVGRTQETGGILHEVCLDIQTVVLGTVVVFEIAGPILIRLAVLRAGEVPLAHAIRHATPGLMDQLRTVWNRWLMAAGRNPWKNRSPEDLTVKELMRTNVEGIPQAASFDEVVAVIEHSRDHTYPVVGDQRELVGVIRYRELSTVLFDPAVGLLVRAADVATAARRFFHPDDSLAQAFKIFKTSKDDCIPVVTPDEPHQLIGVLRRRDVLRLLIREQLDSS